MSHQVDRKSLLKFLAGVSGQGRMLVIPRMFVDATGSLEAALLLSQALYWFDSEVVVDGRVRKSDEEIEEELGFNRKMVQRLMARLAKFGLTRELRGTPASNHYRLDLDVMVQAMCGNADQPVPNKGTPSDGTERPIKLGQNVPSSWDNSLQTRWDKMSHLISTNQDLNTEGGEVVLPEVTRPAEPPQQIEISTTTDQLPEATLGWGQVVPTPANPYPQDSHRQGLEAEQRIQTAAPRLGARLVELRRISGRTEHNYRLWLRDFVVPHIERLGPAFASSLEAALKQGVLANPQYALRDVAKSLEAASPPPREVLRKLSHDQLLDEIIAELVLPPAGGSHGPN